VWLGGTISRLPVIFASDAARDKKKRKKEILGCV
jgi:hypothetical protein